MVGPIGSVRASQEPMLSIPYQLAVPFRHLLKILPSTGHGARVHARTMRLRELDRTGAIDIDLRAS